MMKKLALAAIAAMLVAVALIAYLNLRGEDDMAASSPASMPSAGTVARGAYLVRAGNCMTCHSERGGAPFAGGRAIETPFGTVFSSNLTPHAAAGIGSWSADDFWRALHNGRAKDGRLLYPAFPYPNYTLVTRGDSDAMYAYLRTVAPVERKSPPHRLRWPYSTQPALAVWRALYFTPGSHEDDKAQSAQWNRGAYLVRGLGHCSACHTQRNALGASSDMMDLSGGLIPMQNWYAPSLTSANEAGVADWEPAQIAKLLQSGVAPRGTVLGPMAEVVLQSTQHLSRDDLLAMATYLKALPQSAQSADAAAPRGMTPEMAGRGARLYEKHCVQCHGDKGQGIPDAYPALAGNRAVNLQSTANLVQVVLHGGFPPATTGNPRPFGMPPYATTLSDADIAAVISHIRASWGNKAGAIGEFDVSQQRATTVQ